jgi:hypothetical protein
MSKGIKAIYESRIIRPAARPKRDAGKILAVYESPTGLELTEAWPAYHL